MLHVDPPPRTDPAKLISARAPAALRLVEIRGDSLQPLLYRGDFVLAAPTRRWTGEGLYVFDHGYGQEAVHSCSVTGTATSPRIRLGNLLEVAGRKAYTDEIVTLAEFERTVIGKVAISCKVQDASLFYRFATAA